MTGDTSTTWAIVVIVVIPIAIIAGSELDERLRQRESPLRHAALVIRAWVLPFFAMWALLVPVLGVDRDSLSVQAASTGLMLAVAAAVLRVLRVVINRTREHVNSGGRRRAPELLLMLPRMVVIIATGWLLIQAVWGIDLSAALTALGVTSLVISFALQDTLSGLASGLLLLADQPIQPGHWVNVGDIEGQVIDINWRTTKIQDRNGDVIIVPNSQLATSSIINYTAVQGLHRVVVSVQVAYVNPPTSAKAMLLDAALSTDGVLTDPPPKVRVTQTDDPLMGYDVQMWIHDYAIAPRVKSDFGSNVWYQSHRHDVPLPSPAQDLFLHDAAALAKVGGPSHADLLGWLSQSPLLASLDDDALARLARASRAVRYEVGELIADADDDSRHMVVISEGQANLVLRRPDHVESVITPLAIGEIAGFVSGDDEMPAGVGVRAMTDCQVIIVDGDVTEAVASRSVELAAALNRMSATRRRRAERVLARRPITAPDPTTVDPDEVAE